MRSRVQLSKIALQLYEGKAYILLCHNIMAPKRPVVGQIPQIRFTLQFRFVRASP
jgi:hypothetical protein